MMAKKLEEDSEDEKSAGSVGGRKPQGQVNAGGAFGNERGQRSNTKQSEENLSGGVSEQVKKVRKTEERVSKKKTKAKPVSEIKLSDSETNEKENIEKSKSKEEVKSDATMPKLKVKSFAKMLNENIIENGVIEINEVREVVPDEVAKDKENESVICDEYNVDTDSDKEESPKETIREKKKEESGSSDLEEDEPLKRTKKKKKNEESGCNSDNSDSEPLKKAKKKKKESRSKSDSNSEKEESLKETKKKKNKAKSSLKSDSSDTDKEKPVKETKNKKKEESSKSESSDEESGRRKGSLRKAKKDKKAVKSSFELFRKKRERFLSSKKNEKEGSDSDSSKKNEVDESAKKDEEAKEVDDSEKEDEVKEKRVISLRNKRHVIVSSDEEGEKKNKGSDEDNKSEADSKKNDSDYVSPKVSSGETSSDESHLGKKTTWKRIKKTVRKSSSSDEEKSSSGDDDDKKKKKGRKNIKKILKKDSLHVETKEALKNEEKRRERIEERRKLLEELFPDEKDGEVTKRLVLDFDPETKEPLVMVHKKLVKKLKPHQVEGVRFMWDNCFESVQKLEEDSGSGCILAHCMGLGKTLQVVTLVHTVMTHDLGVHTCLIVCPLSTVTNWVQEFEMWLANIHTKPIVLYDLLKYKRLDARKYHLKDWHENGGVLVVSYDLFRTLTKASLYAKKKPKNGGVFVTTLLDPGPDLVVCDEGHLLKNEDTALSKCMNMIKTSRRIVLTGTPLQNNLMEYHCMVQFVKPNILGTKKEFSNRFANPINNGQFEDSTDLDVKVMKRRSHVLHSILKGCVQRFDYSVLTPFLPEKHEYVLSISLTDTQSKIYRHFITTLSAKATGVSKAARLFNDYHNLQRIWTHPRTMLIHSKKESEKEIIDDSEGSLKDFIVHSDESSESSADSTGESSGSEPKVSKKRITRSKANDPEFKKAVEEEEKNASKNWWDEFHPESDYDDIRASNKLVILFSLLKRCHEVNDKVLVFSQSLYSLDLIEYFLRRIDEGEDDDPSLCGHKDSWVLGVDYFRLDGTTSSDIRSQWCKLFNKESNTRARLFLISTRAGGLGINLFGANRVIIFDASWNPSHDLQSIFRVYRFGQKKTCYIYRFLAEATMEEKIYERQVTKLSLAHRVVDEHQIERHYSMMNLQELYNYDPTPLESRKVPKLPKDKVFADVLASHKDKVVKYHEHDSLLENKEEEELSEEERKAAWKDYEEEKAQKTPIVGLDPMVIQNMLLKASQTAMVNVPGNSLTLNPAFLPYGMLNPGMTFVNPMFSNPSIPPSILQMGIHLGVAPNFNESADSFLNRLRQLSQGPRET